MKVKIVIPSSWDTKVLYETLEEVTICGTIIPKGFTFDAASTPRLLHPWIPPVHIYIKAACIHDYAIDILELPWKKCTELFEQALDEEKVPRNWKTFSIVTSIKLWGYLRKIPLIEKAFHTPKAYVKQ